MKFLFINLMVLLFSISVWAGASTQVECKVRKQHFEQGQPKVDIEQDLPISIESPYFKKYYLEDEPSLDNNVYSVTVPSVGDQPIIVRLILAPDYKIGLVNEFVNGFPFYVNFVVHHVTYRIHCFKKE